MNPADCIAALATPEGPGEIAVVRVSGAGCWNIISERLAGSFAMTAREPLVAGFRWRDASPPVPAIVLPYPAGASYTGEESVELFLPASPPLVRAALQALVEDGVRPATPGEFTRRAFLSGRLDLTQAESVAELIACESMDRARDLRGILRGELGAAIRGIADAILELVALLEAGLDFSEQELDAPDPEVLCASISGILEQARRVLGSPGAALHPRTGASVAIWGRSNAGKSTLFNRWVGSERALTSELPGTTRDPVSATVHWKGLPPFELVDLPGEGVLFASGEESLFEEVDAAARDLGAAFREEGEGLIVYVLDGSRSATELEQEWNDVKASVQERCKLVLNKSDLLNGIPAVPVHAVLSARTGEGVATLEAIIRDWVGHGDYRPRGEGLLFNDRQRRQILRVIEELERLRDAVVGGLGPELVSSDLRAVHTGLEEVTGAMAPDDILDLIFSRFCLGK